MLTLTGISEFKEGVGSRVMIDTDILDGFKEESNQLLGELEEVVERLEQRVAEFPTKLMEEFSQKIDRIMGAAKTIGLMDEQHQGLKRIGNIAEICKRLGYKAAESKNAALVPLFAAFWADTLEVLTELVESVADEAASQKLAQSFSSVLQKRLEWLSQKMTGSGTLPTGTTSLDALGVDDLLKSLG